MAMTAMLPEIIANAIFTGSHGHYRCVCELRRGGMGLVLLSEVVDHNGEILHQPAQHVVIKINQRTDEHARKRMEQEIASLKALNNDQVVSVLDSGEESGYSWYAMEYVGPCNLGDILLVRRAGVPSDLPSIVMGIVQGDYGIVPGEERIGLPISTAVTLIIEVAQVVGHAHQHGVLHRDLKPSNILLDEGGTPILCDFGVARARTLDFNLTAVDEVVGTLDYIAPEQLAGDQIDERSDIYSIGVMLYECLTGQLPPRRSHRWEPIPQLKSLPKPLQAILWQTLHPNPRHRPASAQALAQELIRFHQGQKVFSKGIRLHHFPLVIFYRFPMASGIFIVVTLLLILICFGIYEGIRRHSVRWSEPVQLVSNGQLNPEIRTSLHDPAWVIEAQEKTSMVAGYPVFAKGRRDTGHVALGVELPPRSSQRVSAVVETRQGNQEVSLFLSQSAENWQEGYLFQIGAYDNTCAILSRGRHILWVGPYTVQPNERLEVALYRTGDSVHGYLNGVQVVTQIDTLPFYVRSGGVFTYLNDGQPYRDPPQYKEIHLESAPLSDDVPSEYLLSSYALNSGHMSTGVNRPVAEAALNQGEALLERIDQSDPRYASLLLRQEMMKYGLQYDVLKDLSQYQEHLKGNADYYLHQMKVHAYNAAKLRVTLTEAVETLDQNELTRLVLGISHDLPTEVRILLYEDLLQISDPFPEVQAFIVWRHMLLVPRFLLDFPAYWRSVSHLALMDNYSWFQSYAKRRQESLTNWQKLRRGVPLVDVESHAEIKTSVYLADFMAGFAYEDILSDPKAEHKYILELEKKDIKTSLFENVYAGRTYYTYDNLLRQGRPIEIRNHDRELLFKHLAVAFLLSPDATRLHLATPYFMYQEEVALMEVYLALVAIGEFPQSLFAHYHDSPVGEVLKWLNQGDPDQTLPPDIPLSAAAGPIINLVIARHYHTLGNQSLARYYLNKVAGGKPWFPATQAAQSILQWGFPP